MPRRKRDAERTTDVNSEARRKDACITESRTGSSWQLGVSLPRGLERVVLMMSACT